MRSVRDTIQRRGQGMEESENESTQAQGMRYSAGTHTHHFPSHPYTAEMPHPSMSQAHKHSSITSHYCYCCNAATISLRVLLSLTAGAEDGEGDDGEEEGAHHGAVADHLRQRQQR